MHPQGFLSWISENAPWLAQATAYKYMDAARGAGLTAWHAPEAVDALVETVLANATLASLIAEGKKMLPAPKPDPSAEDDKPSWSQMTFDAISGFSAQTEQVLSLRERMTPKQHQLACAQAYRALRELTGSPWGPTDSDDPTYMALIAELKKGGI